MSCPAWRLVQHDSLPSTSDLCIERAEAGEPAGLAVLALHQTRGRGSRGRSWSEASGNLALSVLLRPEPGALWPFVAALAFHDALAAGSAAAGDAIRLKWPNDVTLGGRKLGGILIEASPAAAGGLGWLVIGFGANLGTAPALADRQAACLAELGPAVDPATMAGRLLQSLSLRLGQRHRPALIRAEWLARAHPAGTKLAVRGADGQTTGLFSSIAEDGSLLLDVAGEIRRINTGEVLVLPSGTSCPVP